MSIHATEKLAEFIEKLAYSDFSAEVAAAAKTSLLDFIGVAIAGYSTAQLNGLLIDSLVRFDGSDECTILGQSKKASAVHAALINATSGHSLDLDDGHRQALGIAAIQSAGLLAVVHSGQIMKPLNAGKAAYNGVLSALLARGGASGK